jgi:hypothetical protein
VRRDELLHTVKLMAEVKVVKRWAAREAVSHCRRR